MLVNSKEIAKVLHIAKYGFFGTFIGWLLIKILRISKLNKIYNAHNDKSGAAFLNAILDEVEIQFEVSANDLKRIPTKDAFITISNHPLGGIDGILLLKLVLEKRTDYKIMGNFLLHKIQPLQPYVLAVNPFEDRKNAKSSIAGIKEALVHLKNGKPLGIFPAGEVSTHKDGVIRVDKKWENGAIRLIQKAKVPIIPIYFHAKNSRLFYVLAKISDTLRTAKLPSELLTQKRRIIKIRIGKPISIKDQNDHLNFEDFYQYIRKKTYMLANTYEKKVLNISSTIQKFKKPKAIIPAIETEKLVVEIKNLRNANNKLLASKGYEVYLAKANRIPNLLQEIGRLREITFREIGEGTNKEIDLDLYDHTYQHLFLWDINNKKLVGAYRMGFGKKLFAKNGIEGLYVNTLFRIEPELFGMMQNTIEMGRAFVRKEYQKKPMPLFLLWRGIIHVTLRYPDYKYLLGGVSISNQFSEFSKSLMIEFMKSNYYDPYVAQYIRAKKEFKIKLKDADKDFVFDNVKSDMKKFDRIIDEMEPDGLRIPVLLKKYIKQNCKLVAFNVDPKFNNAIDGLIYVRIADLPVATVRPVMEEYQKELENRLVEIQKNDNAVITSKFKFQHEK